MGKKKYVWVSIITSFIPSFDIDMTFLSIFTHGHIIFSGNLHIFFHSFVFHSDPLKKKNVFWFMYTDDYKAVGLPRAFVCVMS